MKFLAFPFLLGLFLFASETATAQNYKVAAGWRSGMETNGISVKIAPIQGIAVEGIYNFFPLGHSVTGMVQSTSCVFGIRALQMYAGVGAHYRLFYQDGRYSDPFRGTYEVIAPPGTRGWGLDGQLGLELKLPVLPIMVYGEVKPMIEWTDYRSSFTALDPALGIRLAF